MIKDTRLDPDELLRKIQKEEQKEISGRLKVFLEWLRVWAKPTRC